MSNPAAVPTAIRYAPGTTPVINRHHGLHARLNRVSHFDFNVSDLERSRKWYEKYTPLRVIGKTCAEQAFLDLDVQHGSFEGYLLKDPNHFGAMPMIHLVEWKEPKPVGHAYYLQGHVGWYRLVGLTTDLQKLRDELETGGYKPFFPSTNYRLKLHPTAPHIEYKIFCVRDPDGITLEILEDQRATMPISVPHNTANFDKNFPFLTEILGLDFLQGLQTEVPHQNVYSPVGGMTRWDGGFFGIRSDTRFIFDWLEWDKEHSDPTPYRLPNNIGIMRCVFEVDDIHRSYEILKKAQEQRFPNLKLFPPEIWDLGAGFGGPRRVVSFTDDEGVRFQLIEQVPSPYAQIHPYGFDPFADSRQ